MSLNTSLPILKAKVIFIKYLVSGTGTLLVIGIGVFLDFSFLQANLYKTYVKNSCEIVIITYRLFLFTLCVQSEN